MLVLRASYTFPPFHEMGHKYFNYCFHDVTDDYTGLILGWNNGDMLKECKEYFCL